MKKLFITRKKIATRKYLFITREIVLHARNYLFITRKILLRLRNYILRVKYCYARKTIYYAQNIATREKLFTITRKILLRARNYLLRAKYCYARDTITRKILLN